MQGKIIVTKLNRNNKRYLISALMRENKIVEIYAEHEDAPSIMGNIYIAKVQNIVKNLNAAFVEIAPGKVCYYPFEKNMNPIIVRGNDSGKIVPGTELLVQVVKDQIKSKAPSVSSNLNMSGRYAVLTSENQQIGVSGKLTKEQKDHYRSILENGPQLPYGVIVRTSAAQVSDETLLKEIAELKYKLSDLIRLAQTRSCFSCIRQQEHSYLRFLKNLASGDIYEIVTDETDIMNGLMTLKNEYEDIKDIPIRFYQDSLLDLHKLYSIEYQIENALKKQVWLKSGGYLVIEQTEALVVIDVNTGKSINKKTNEEHFRQINMEAAKEAARQIRLRNLSGIILIDFIDMKASEDREALLTYMRELVKTDPIPVRVVDMTRLQLMELTRKKVQKSLKEQLT